METCLLSSVKHTASPSWMHETSAWGWFTGMTQRDGMGREEGGGFRMGNTLKQQQQKKKKQRYYFANKGPSSQGYGFSSGHVCM